MKTRVCGYCSAPQAHKTSLWSILFCWASQQTNSGRVRDQPGLPVPEASLIWDFWMKICLYVYHRICLDFKYGPRNRGSFVPRQSIQKKKNKRTLRTQIKCDVEKVKPGRDPVSYRKPRFCKRKVWMPSESKKFTWIEAIRFLGPVYLEWGTPV